MIYLDHLSTTPVDPQVAAEVNRLMQTVFGNASSVDHAVGRRAAAVVKESAQKIAGVTGVPARHVVFTSGATESINLALRGLSLHRRELKQRLKILASPLEHKAVLDTLNNLDQANDVSVDYLQAESDGTFSDEHLNKSLEKGYDLLVMMAANNETGQVYDIEKTGNYARRHGAMFFCDVTQAAGKIPLKLDEWGVHAAALSGHKLYAPQGVGALLLSDDFKIKPLMTGGSQQKYIRPGTLNMPGIGGFATAAELAAEKMQAENEKLDQMRRLFLKRLQSQIEVVPTVALESSLPHTLHFHLPALYEAPVYNKMILGMLGDKLAMSTGSACTSGIEQPSHVLKAMGLSEQVMRSAFRFSCGRFNTEDEVIKAADILSETVNRAV